MQRGDAKGDSGPHLACEGEEVVVVLGTLVADEVMEVLVHHRLEIAAVAVLQYRLPVRQVGLLAVEQRHHLGTIEQRPEARGYDCCGAPHAFVGQGRHTGNDAPQCSPGDVRGTGDADECDPPGEVRRMCTELNLIPSRLVGCVQVGDEPAVVNRCLLLGDGVASWRWPPWPSTAKGAAQNHVSRLRADAVGRDAAMVGATAASATSMTPDRPRRRLTKRRSSRVSAGRLCRT